MKFQNPSLNFILNGRTYGRTHAHTCRNQYAPHFFKVGGIIRIVELYTHIVERIIMEISPYKNDPLKPVLI